MDFSKNETIELAHEILSKQFSAVADYIERHKIGWKETVALLREISDEHEAQSMVVNLRDGNNK